MKKIIVCLLFAVTHSLTAQVSYDKQYASAKDLFEDGKYNLAMESFKPLITYDKANGFSEYASFYYAIAAYRQGYTSVAKDMLNQILKLYPNWEKMNDVNYWLARIMFDNGDYFQGLRLLNGIEKKDFERDIQDLKIASLKNVTDLETLRMMHEDYPKDPIVARYLALALSKELENDDSRKELEEIIRKFNLEKKDFIPELPKTFYKERYSVSLLMPFGVAYLEPTPGRKRNQVILDFYEGMKLANDTLAAQGIEISLRAYDTDRSVEKTLRLLSTDELKNTDVIVGPLFPEVNDVVQEFSERYRINTIHPFSNLTETIESNPYGFLFQPSAQVMGKKAAAYVAEHADGKETMVFYGTGKKDSVLAASFAQAAQDLGLQVVLSQQVSKEQSRMISDILSTPTEFDEFKYPTEFTLKKDSIQSVFVASDDPLLYTKVVGAAEMRGDQLLVVGSENWLDDNTIEFEKFESLGIVLQSPTFAARNTPGFTRFEKAFIARHGRVPSSVARLGYELMLFLGNTLKKHGVYFQEALSSGDVLPGYLSEGFDYRVGRNNQLVPFTAIRDGRHTLIEKR